MVPRLLTNYQLETLNRQQIREIERKHKKAFNKLRKLTSKSNLPVIFDNCTVTNFGNFGLFESFKKAIGFQEMLQKYVTVYRHHNCRYSAAELIDTMIDCIALGIVRFDHMNSLKFDSGYQKVKDVDQVPDERTLRYLITRFTRITFLIGFDLLTFLPEGISNYEVTTIRRLILNIPGNIVGNGRYHHVRMASNTW